MDWQESEEGSSSGWEFAKEMPRGEMSQEEDSCYKVSTRSKNRHENKKEKRETKEKKKAKKEVTFDIPPEVPPDQDSDYHQNHPKLFYSKVNVEVKRQLEELEALEIQENQRKDLERVQEIKAMEEAQVKEDEPLVKAQPKVEETYDIKEDIRNCSVTTKVGQLLKDNPMYRRQLKEMLIGKKRRRMPKVGTDADVLMICEDLGTPKMVIQISGCILSYVPVDGGSGVNIMIEATAHQLGFKQFEPTARTMRLANGARVVPVGTLTQVPTLIGGVTFYLNFFIMRPTRPSTYPVLIGRPWLYGAKVTSNWGKKQFRFGKPIVTVPWGAKEHQGETTQCQEEYDSEMSTELESDEVFIVSSLTKEEVFGEHTTLTCLIEGEQVVCNQERITRNTTYSREDIQEKDGNFPVYSNLEVSKVEEEEEALSRHYCETLEVPSNIEEILERATQRRIERYSQETLLKRDTSILDGGKMNSVMSEVLKPMEQVTMEANKQAMRISGIKEAKAKIETENSHE
ncbi:unnamed protein product [Calypogeia fissa]